MIRLGANQCTSVCCFVSMLFCINFDCLGAGIASGPGDPSSGRGGKAPGGCQTYQACAVALHGASALVLPVVLPQPQVRSRKALQDGSGLHHTATNLL